MTVADDFAAVLEENRRRRMAMAVEYDPVAGIGCCGRRVVLQSGERVPEAMVADPGYPARPAGGGGGAAAVPA